MFRAATSADLGAILDLYRQLHPSDPVLDDGSGRRVLDHILASPDLTILVLEEQGRVVATTYLNVIPNLTRSAAPYAVVENVVVDRDRRGTGLGKQIMSRTLETAWSLGCYKVMLMTGSDEAATHAFYRSCGLSADDKTAFVARPS